MAKEIPSTPPRPQLTQDTLSPAITGIIPSPISYLTPLDIPIFHAISTGNTAIVIQLLRANQDLITQTNSAGNTPLMEAIDKFNRHQDITLIRACLAYCRTTEELDARNSMGMTALHLAAEENLTSVIDLILDHDAGASLNIYDDDGYNPFDIAMEYNAFDAAAILVQNHANFNGFIDNPDEIHPLIKAYQNNHMPLCNALIARGINLNATIGINGINLMMMAAMNNDASFINTLCTKGLDVNIPDAYGRTAIIHAAMHGKVEAIIALHNAGAHIPKNIHPNIQCYIESITTAADIMSLVSDDVDTIDDTGDTPGITAEASNDSTLTGDIDNDSDVDM